MKTYENIYENNIKLRDKYCWIIYGSAETILNVYEKLEHQSSHFCDTANSIRLALSQTYTDVIGTYLFYDKGSKITYWIFENKNDQNKAKQDIISVNYILQGELKLENNKLILDQMEVNVNKYNL